MSNLKPFLYTLLITYTSFIFSQSEPFNCVSYAYLFQNNDVFSIDLASGNSSQVGTDITAGSINATGYNSKDGYIWGSLSSPEKSIVRIGNDFSTDIYTINELPTSNRYVGDVSPDGIYYLKPGGTTYYAIDLDPASANYLTSLGTGTLSQDINVHDWAFNSLDNYLYTVEKATNYLYRIDVSTGNVENLGEVPIVSGLNYTFGAVYFDSSGNFYISSNQTGTVYIIYDVTNITSGGSISSNLFAYGPSSSSNDGARCPTAPVPVENCANGTDDDGDGLVDCDDPSCSGVAACPVIDPSTSGGNEGGLESNSRLSEQINKRNFNRIKSNYKFSKEKARRVLKTSSYGKVKAQNSFGLRDFIPLEIIQEDEAIESTPTDLLYITNATEVFSVDYQKNSKTVASILALKTEGKVYEHTKYICDRLLGAELVSVSTVEINGVNFIRSIIKNTEGNTEFVLSFSAKLSQDQANFSVESHWNLDKYSQSGNWYNFQIWSNSIDNLALLGEEVVKLLGNQKEINNYLLSPPPTVFVKNGFYKDGSLHLNIVNTNRSESVVFDAGYRATETTDTNYISSSIDLNNYLTNVEVETGKLFDIGFRIGDGVHTPDDVFMSDGPWGVDDAANSTEIQNFKVLPNETDAAYGEMAIERNINLKATTKEYVSVYKAFTARYQPIDLTEYNMLKFNASGTGILEIRLIKSGISNWEEQFKAQVDLTNTEKEFSIPFQSFTSNSSHNLQFNDVTTIVFTMVANGAERVKELSLKELKLANTTLAIQDNEKDTSKITIAPNPMNREAQITFNSSLQQNGTLQVYNQLGQLTLKQKLEITSGENTVKITKDNLSTGIYFIMITMGNTSLDAGKLVIH